MSDIGPIKVNQKMAIFGFDMENEISVCVGIENLGFETQV
jgi:hypothetical protein